MNKSNNEQTVSEAEHQAQKWLDQHVDDVKAGVVERFELYVRSLSPVTGVQRPQQRVTDQLRALEQSDVVNSVTVTVWGEQIPTPETVVEPAGHSALQTMQRLEQGAEECGASINQYFRRRDVQSRLADEEYSSIVPPQMCLAAVADDTIECVLPCVVDGDPISIPEYINALQSTHLPQSERTAQELSVDS
jgi:hypothetical protein